MQFNGDCKFRLSFLFSKSAYVASVEDCARSLMCVHCVYIFSYFNETVFLVFFVFSGNFNVLDSVVVSVLKSQSRGRGFRSRQKLKAISASPAPLPDSAIMSTLTLRLSVGR